MGQRHQVYINLPAVNYTTGGYGDKPNPNNRGPKVVGFHHQWLYGWTATRFLARALKYIAATDQKYGPFANTAHDALPALAALYSVEPETGYYHNTHPFDDGDAEVSNPHCGDNNDGITVIDLTGDKPAYCFYSLGHTEGAKVLKEGCYSADEYLRSYYPKLIDRSGQSMAGEVAPVLAYLADFRVLTREDMRRIFPNLSAKRAA